MLFSLLRTTWLDAIAGTTLEKHLHFWGGRLNDGLEVDLDCASWFDVDDCTVQVTEALVVAFIIYLNWSRRPGQSVHSLKTERAVFEQTLVPKAKRATTRSSVGPPTIPEILLGLLLLTPLPILFWMRYHQGQLATLFHICHLALLANAGCLIFDVPDSVFLYWCFPLLGSAIPALAAPDWRGWDPKWNMQWPGGRFISSCWK